MTPKKRGAQHQGGLFGATLSCPDIDQLPLIGHEAGKLEVQAPGSVYQPLLIKHDGGVDVGPGSLNEDEAAFVRHLVAHLCQGGQPPFSDKTPLLWGKREVWLKRNIEKWDTSFRLRVDDEDWFYPDFIVWILDYETRTQTFGFVDPKGLTLGTTEGWRNHKIVGTTYKPHVVQQSLIDSDQIVEFEGEVWTFRVRGVLVSTSSFDSLVQQGKFLVHDVNANLVPPSLEDFQRARIVFPKSDGSHIEDVLTLLTEDSDMDRLLAKALHLKTHAEHPASGDEAGFDLMLRIADTEPIDCVLVGNLLADYVRPDAQGRFGLSVAMRRRQELLHFASEGLWGFGADKAVDIRDHPTPCEEVWKRRLGVAGS